MDRSDDAPMNGPNAPHDPIDTPFEIELSTTDTRRRERRGQRARGQRSYRALTAVVVVAVAGATGFMTARSTRSEAAVGQSVETPDVNSTQDEPTGEETTATPRTPTTAEVDSTSSSGPAITASDMATFDDPVLAPSTNTPSPVSEPPTLPTYVGSDRVDSRIAGQPIQIVANNGKGLIDLDLTKEGSAQVESFVTELASGSDYANGTLPVMAAGSDWVVAGDGWEALVLIKDGQEPRQLIERYSSYAEFPDGVDWAWKADTTDTGYRLTKIDLAGNEIANSDVPLPSWFGLWLVPGQRLTAVIGGVVFEFTHDGERPISEGFPIATGRHTVVLLRCGDQLDCRLVGVNLDTGAETTIGDSALAAQVNDYQGPSISPNDRYLAFSSDDATVVVDLVTGELVASIQGYTSDDLTRTSAWSNDSRWWFFNDDSDGPSALDAITGERFPIFDPTLDIEHWTSLTVRSP